MLRSPGRLMLSQTMYNIIHRQGLNHTAEKLRGTQGLGPNTGALVGVSAWRGRPGRGRPLPLWGSGGIIPAKFLKTQMLNPALWWLMRSLVGSLGRASDQTTSMSKSWGTNTLLVPQHKSWESVSPVPTVAAPQYACRGIALLLKLACYAIRCRQTNIHTMRQTNRRTRSFYPRRPTESTYAVNFAFGCRRWISLFFVKITSAYRSTKITKRCSPPHVCTYQSINQSINQWCRLNGCRHEYLYIRILTL